MKVRTRFAPSPTGALHLGGLRTALFNWLFAQHYQGKFILRIEDTDTKRSKPEYLNSILKALKWLGLTWDEGPEVGGKAGPYHQSARLELYQKWSKQLLEEGKAYFCFCSPEALRSAREEQLGGYNGKCRRLSSEEIERFFNKGLKPAVRFKTPSQGKVTYFDLIRGEISFDASSLDDFIILRSDGLPTYNFSVVVDDITMEITHVIRGEDHISNTPKQVLLYQAFNASLPKFAHLPNVIWASGQKLSKREGATSVDYYRAQGYLPEALMNYLALLGWSYDGKRELFTSQELISYFTLERVAKTSAVFDLKKLNWINGVYIRKLSLEKFTELAIPYLVKNGLILAEEVNKSRQEIQEIMKLLQPRTEVLSEVVYLSEYFFKEEITYDEKAVNKILKREGSQFILEKLLEKLNSLSSFTLETTEKAIRNLAQELSLSPARVIHPTRVALTGRDRGPGLFELMVVLGREKVTQRIRECLERLNTGEWSNGRTRDSGSRCGGSNPPSPAYS